MLGRLSWQELAGASLVLAAMSVAVFGWYALHGGFVADDWVNADRYYFHTGSGFWGAVENYQTPSRPVAALYVSLTYAALGTHFHLHLVLSVVLAAFLSVAFFAFLRTVGLETLLALAAAALLLVFPSSDSTRFWSTGSQIDLFIGLYLVAAMIAIAGRRKFGPDPTRPAVATQALASVLAATAVAGYEIVAPAVLLSGILYRLVCGRGGVVWRSVLDAVPTLLVLLIFSRKFGNGGVEHGLGLFDNLRLVADGAVSVLGYSIYPTRGISPWPVLAAAAAVICVILVVRWRAAPTPGREAIVRWLRPILLAIGGVAVGYLMIVPKADQYPLYAPGVQNRVNCFAALGISVLVVLLIAAVASILVAALPRLSEDVRAPLRQAVTAVLFLGILAVYVVRISEDEERWRTAAAIQAQILAGAHALVPSPPARATIFTSPSPGYSAPSIPIFGGGGNDDELSAFRVSYDSGRLRAFPLLEAVGVTCGPRTMWTSDTGKSETDYGKAILVDFRASTVRRPRNRRECLEDSAAMKPFGQINLSEEW